MSEVSAYLALGSNLGDRAAAIGSAIAAIDNLESVRVVAHSTLHETPPVGPAGQGPYLNAAAHLRTSRSPRDLLSCFLSIEAAHGRLRSSEQRWGPRQLDIDLLLYGDLIIDQPGLTVPHPRMHKRLFVLQPLAEIAPEVLHPTLGVQISALLARLEQAEATSGREM